MLVCINHPSCCVLTNANFVPGTQFHAEYQSQVLNPSVSPPLYPVPQSILTLEQRPYLGFVAASAGVLDEVLKQEPVQAFKAAPVVVNGTAN